MKFLPPLLLTLALCFFTTCVAEETPSTGTVATTIDFLAKYDDADLAIQRIAYDYPTGAKLKVTLFQYYLSDLELLPADGGAPVRLADIELIRYQSAAEEAITSRTYEVPVGDYVGLRFGLGVKPALNAQDPQNFAADYVLNENEFWSAAARYVFAKIEANADLEDDGTFDTGLSYHLGSDALYTTVTFTGDFSVSEAAAPRLLVAADVLRAMSGPTEAFDIGDPEQQRVHGGNQSVGLAIWERLADQFSLSLP